MKRSNLPSKGDFVVIKIKRITNHGAFADLIEYPGKEGFIHISQISSSWVKNIRSHVKEGQVRVALVTHVDPSKRIIDLSLRSIKPNREKRKVSEWKREKKADKFFEMLAKDMGTDVLTAYKVAGWKLEDVYGETYAGLEEIAISGEEALKGIDIPDNWKKKLVEYAKEKVEPPKVEIKGFVEIAFPGSKGVDRLKRALALLQDSGISVVYQGAPRYFVRIESSNYKDAESKLKSALTNAEKFTRKEKGQFSFERIED